MLINGMYGLGDNIFQRAFVREIKERVYLRTCWPQLYSDLSNVYPVAGSTRLRTQKKNMSRISANIWHQAPALPAKKIGYGNAAFKKGSILDAMGKCFGVNPRVFDMPHFEGPDIQKPYAVIRPVTVRKEWLNIARNPLPCYVSVASEILMDHGYTVVSVADIHGSLEWADELPRCDIAYNHGELPFEPLMGLIQDAAVVVGGVGWIVPAAIAAGVPLITILGGQGGHNAPEKITGTPMDLDKTSWIYPDNYCRCTKMTHLCDKVITDFEYKFDEVLCLNQLRKTA